MGKDGVELVGVANKCLFLLETHIIGGDPQLTQSGGPGIIILIDQRLKMKPNRIEKKSQLNGAKVRDNICNIFGTR